MSYVVQPPALPPPPQSVPLSGRVLRAAWAVLLVALVAGPAVAQDDEARFPLTESQTLERGQRIYSPRGGHFMVLNPDGNLVVARADGSYVWGFDTLPEIDHTRVGRVDWQADGNLAAYDADGGYLWSALTEGPVPGSRLLLSLHGKLRIMTPDRRILWSSDGVIPTGRGAEADDAPEAEPELEAPRAPEPEPEPDPEPPTLAPPPDVPGQGFPFTAGQSLAKDTPYRSASGNHVLTLQSIGNLVVSGSEGGFVWGFNTLDDLDFRQVDAVRMQPNGNLVAVDAGGQVIWRAVSRNPDPAARLVLTYDGALQLVSDARGVLWASDGILAPSVEVFKMAPPATSCTPDAGWDKCLMLNDPQIKIQGTSRVSQSAMNGAANVYAEITARLTPRYPRNEFDGFGVFITNGESLDQLNALDPIKGVHADGYRGTDGNGGGTRNTLRGGACCDTGALEESYYVWISEQMICKDGVQTRNDDVAAGRVGGQPDHTPRTVDQVIHEFGHSIDQEFGLRAERVRGLYDEPIEGFAQSVHYFFGAPARPLTAPQMTLMNELFTSQASFSCEGYTPTR